MMKNFSLFIVYSLLCTISLGATFTTLKVGDSSPIAASAALEVKSTVGAVLLPRMTTTQKNAIPSPTNGDMIFDTTLGQFSGYSSGSWQSIGGGSWGSITGTLSAQTDLQNALNLKLTNPMTTFGDTLYENSSPAPARVAGNTTTTTKYFSQTGTGSASAAPSWTQPACSNLSNAAASCSTDATNASNISSGTLGAGRLPNPSSSTLGGVQSAASVTHEWINSISTSGIPSLTQPAFGDISGSLSSPQLPNPLTLAQIAVPSNPSSGFDSLFFQVGDVLSWQTPGGLTLSMQTPSGSSIVKSLSTGTFGIAGGSTFNPVLDSGGINPVTVTIIANGGDLEIGLLDDGTNSVSDVYIDGRGTGSNSSVQLQLFRDGTPISTQQYYLQNNLTINEGAYPTNTFRYIDTPSPGTHTYTLQAFNDATTGNNSGINNAVLYARRTGGISVSATGATQFISSIVNTDSSTLNGAWTNFSNSPALTFAPTVSGTYKIYSSAPVFTQGAGNQTQTRIHNTSGGATLLAESQSNQGCSSATVNCFNTSYISSIYNLTAGTSYVFDIQGQLVGGSSILLTGSNSPFYMFGELVSAVVQYGVTQAGAFGSTPNANGASISTSTLTLQPADGTHPGGVSLSSQTIAGSKSLGVNTSDKTTIGSASSAAIHQVNGGVNFTTRTISGSTTIDTTTTDYEILANCSSACNLTLPAPSNGREIHIVDINGQSQLANITLVRHGSEQINNVAASYVLAGNGASWAVTSDGTNWWVKFTPVATWAFGSGTDGAQSITASNTSAGPLSAGSLTRDAYWTKLTMGASGSFKTAGFKVFAQVCDFTNAITGAITATPAAAGNGAAAATAGAAGALPYAAAGTVGVSTVGIIGGVGTATTGTEGATAVAASPGMGGPSGAGAIGGTGTGGAGGAARAAVATTTPWGMNRFAVDLLRGIALGQGGGGAPGGSGAGGNTTAGGGGGGGGAGGGVIYAACGTVIRGTNTNASIIQAIGGQGGNGGTTVTAGAGGGSGGPGGGGGMIYFLYAFETGSAITNGLDASGGLGGSGGNATLSPGTGGDGAGGGGGGRIDIFNLTTGIGTETFGGTATTGNAHSTITGGGTKAGQVTQANL